MGGGPKCFGNFNTSYATSELGKPLKPCVLPKIYSPKGTSKIVKVAAAFFHNLKQNMTQTCCSFKCLVVYVHENYKWQKVLVTMQYSKIHTLKLYSKQKMNQQIFHYLQPVAEKNQKCIHKEIKGILNVAYTCYHLLQRLFSFCPPPKHHNNCNTIMLKLCYTEGRTQTESLEIGVLRRTSEPNSRDVKARRRKLHI